jgi:uncharacterized protein
MGNALRDQLLKAGLVNDKQVKKAVKEKHKESRQQQGQNRPAADEAKLQAQRQAAEKAERDRQLNLQRKEAADRKALAAQIKQLVETHRQSAGDGEIPYNFTDGNTVKRIYVSARVRDQLAAGKLAVVRCDKEYGLVSPDIAEKIRERSAEAIVLWNQPQPAEPAPEGDDPYARYQIPDDLIW